MSCQQVLSTAAQYHGGGRFAGGSVKQAASRLQAVIIQLRACSSGAAHLHRDVLHPTLLRPTLRSAPFLPPHPHPAAVLDLGGIPQLLYLSSTASLSFKRVRVQGGCPPPGTSTHWMIHPPHSQLLEADLSQGEASH